MVTLKRNIFIYRLYAGNYPFPYVGQTVDMSARMAKHKADLKKGRFGHSELQAAYNIDPTFRYEIVDSVNNYFGASNLVLGKEFADCLEGYYSSKLNATNVAKANLACWDKYEDLWKLYGIEFIPSCEMISPVINLKGQTSYKLPDSGYLLASGGRYYIGSQLCRMDVKYIPIFAGRNVYFNYHHYQSIILHGLSDLEAALVGLPLEADRNNCSIRQLVLAINGIKLNYNRVNTFPASKVFGLDTTGYDDRLEKVSDTYIKNNSHLFFNGPCPNSFQSQGLTLDDLDIWTYGEDTYWPKGESFTKSEQDQYAILMIKRGHEEVSLPKVSIYTQEGRIHHFAYIQEQFDGYLHLKSVKSISQSDIKGFNNLSFGEQHAGYCVLLKTDEVYSFEGFDGLYKLTLDKKLIKVK